MAGQKDSSQSREEIILGGLLPRHALLVKALVKSGGKLPEAGQVLTNKDRQRAGFLAKQAYKDNPGIRKAFLQMLDENGLDNASIAKKWKEGINLGWGEKAKHSDALKALIQVTKMKGLDNSETMGDNVEKLMSETKEEIDRKGRELLSRMQRLLPEGEVVE